MACSEDAAIDQMKRAEEKKQKRNEYMREYMRRRLQCKKTYTKAPTDTYNDYIKKYNPLERITCDCGKNIIDSPEHRERHLASQIHAKLMVRKQNFLAKQEKQQLLQKG